MFDFLGRMAAGHPWKVLALWFLTAIGLTCLAPDWDSQTQDDDIRFLPSQYSIVRAHELLEEAFPKDVSACRAIFAIERTEGTLTSNDFRLVDQIVKKFKSLQESDPKLQITGVSSYRDGPVGSRLTSKDKHCTLVQLSLATPYLAVQTRHTIDRAQQEIEPFFQKPDAPKLFVTGPGGIGRDLVKASAESLDQTTWATVILVVVVLLVVYRSPLLAMIPLFTIGMAVWVSLKLLAIATLIPGVHIVNVSQVFAIVILFGAGTDYCLFLIGRYREELEIGQPPATGVQKGVRAVGGALAASAGTVICGLGMMGFAEFGKIRSAGPVIAVGLAIGLAASLTITPALLRLGKKTAFWPQRIRLISPARQQSGFWHGVSQLVVRRPGWIFACSLLPMLPLAWLGTQIKPSFKPIGDLNPNAGSVRGLDAIQAHFTAGETGPLTVLLVAKKDWTTPEGRQLIHHLSQGFCHLDCVAEVRSLSQPLGIPSETKVITTSEKPSGLFGNAQKNLGSLMQNVTQQIAEGHYLSKVEQDHQTYSVTRLDVIFHSDPFDAQSVAALGLIETWLKELLPQRAETASMNLVRAETFGVTVHTRDMGMVIARDQLIVNSLVMLGVFLILFILVRRLWLASYLLGTVLLSYYVTLGATALFAMWLTGKPFGEMEWRVPFFLFVILVAIGEDYNILLVTRILEERKRHGLIEGTRRGLAATGGTITACGLIMAGTFGTLMLADLSTLKQIGFALGIGVILDTLVVRPLLVPSFMLLIWRDGIRSISPIEKEPTTKIENNILPFSTSSTTQKAA